MLTRDVQSKTGIGEVTWELRDISTNEIIERKTEYNTQMTGLFETSTDYGGWNHMWTSSNSKLVIYISDSMAPLTRISQNYQDRATTFNIAGSGISGEYWPQIHMDAENGLDTHTFKFRFQPPTSGTRSINTIGLWNPNGSSYMAALRLQTPCVQTSTAILDVYYKVYVYYDTDPYLGDKNVNSTLLNAYGSSYKLYNTVKSYQPYIAGTSTLSPFEGNQSNPYGIVLYPIDYDLRYETGFEDRVDVTIPSNSPYMRQTLTTAQLVETTRNKSQGSTMRKMSMATTAYVGTLIHKIGSSRGDLSSNTRNNTIFCPSATPLLPSGSSPVQSVYLKNALSAGSNFAYLDPSSIGSSSAKLVINADNWDKLIPYVFRVRLGGTVAAPTYTVEMRKTFGFGNNLFQNENMLPCSSAFRVPADVGQIRHTSNDGNFMAGTSAVRWNDQQVITTSPTGISIINPYTGVVVNIDSDSTPELTSTGIQLVKVDPTDSSILVATTDLGLLRVSLDLSSITKVSDFVDTIVSGDTCYTIDVKDNGDIWGAFEGGLAKFTKSTNTWEFFNATTPVTFISTHFNSSWSNVRGIFCRKDDGGDDEIALTRINGTAITWWSPSFPTPTDTTNNSQSTAVNNFNNNRSTSQLAMSNIRGTSTWLLQSYSTNRIYKIGFRTNTSSLIPSVPTSSSRPINVTHFPNFQGTQEYRICVYGYDSNNELFVALFDANMNEVNNFKTLGTLATYYRNAPTVMMDDTFTTITYSAQTVALINLVTAVGMESWEKYGWDSGTNSWVRNLTTGKPVHTSMEDIPRGIKIRFDVTGVNDFIPGEYWVAYLMDGIHKDNSTTLNFALTVHGRPHYRTGDLSAAVVPTVPAGGIVRDVELNGCTNLSTSSPNVLGWRGGYGHVAFFSTNLNTGTVGEFVTDKPCKVSTKTNASGFASSVSSSYTWFGLNLVDSGTPEMRWGFRFQNNGFMIVENTNTTRTSLISYGSVDDVYSVEYDGTNVICAVNGTPVHTFTGVSFTGRVQGWMDVQFSERGRVYFDMRMNYTEDMPTLIIGNITSQTGAYDPDFAMVEAWVTNPPSHTITIDGVPARVIYDPKIPPQPGEVLLLQKTGTLLFNPADSGKPVTCSALILKEL